MTRRPRFWSVRSHRQLLAVLGVSAVLLLTSCSSGDQEVRAGLAEQGDVAQLPASPAVDSGSGGPAVAFATSAGLFELAKPKDLQSSEPQTLYRFSDRWTKADTLAFPSPVPIAYGSQVGGSVVVVGQGCDLRQNSEAVGQECVGGSVFAAQLDASTGKVKMAPRPAPPELLPTSDWGVESSQVLNASTVRVSTFSMIENQRSVLDYVMSTGEWIKADSSDPPSVSCEDGSVVSPSMWHSALDRPGFRLTSCTRNSYLYEDLSGNAVLVDPGSGKSRDLPPSHGDSVNRTVNGSGVVELRFAVPDLNGQTEGGGSQAKASVTDYTLTSTRPIDMPDSVRQAIVGPMLGTDQDTYIKESSQGWIRIAG